MTTQALTVACLCAAWCRTCDAYRAVFDAAVDELRASGWVVAAHWIDIEDEADLLGDLDVETFPTLLVAHGVQVRFFGPLEPQPETVRRMLLAATAVDDWAVCSALRHACASGAPSGPLLSPDTASIRTEPLDAAIALTMKLGVASPAARVALCSALVARRLRQAVLDGAFDFLELVLREAEEEAELLPSVAPT